MPQPCHRADCTNPAHVVLFATARQFLTTPTAPGQRVHLCLDCGGQVYDALRAWRRNHTVAVASWLVDDVKADRLPSIHPDGVWHTQTRARPRTRRHDPKGRR
jgi:hypothetical protein